MASARCFTATGRGRKETVGAVPVRDGLSVQQPAQSFTLLILSLGGLFPDLKMTARGGKKTGLQTIRNRSF